MFSSSQQLAICFAVLWGASAVVFLFSDQFGIPHYAHPIGLTIFVLLFLLNTLNVCFRHCRFWLLKALVSGMCSPFLAHLSFVFMAAFIRPSNLRTGFFECFSGIETSYNERIGKCQKFM